MPAEHQIFQTDKPIRWQGVKWSFRTILFVFLFLTAITVLSVYSSKNPTGSIETSEYRGSKNKLTAISYQERKGTRENIKTFLENKERSRKAGDTSQNIRAAFYAPWSRKQSLASLQDYGTEINVIFPEWFFINNTDHKKIETRIDKTDLDYMKKLGIKIMPMLTNFNSFKKTVPDFDGTLVHDILNDGEKQQLFIQNILDTLTAYGFSGINIDFEELNEKTDDPLNNFQKNLFVQLHSRGFTVTQDVAAFNTDYDYKKLAENNDYLVLMAYDEFNDWKTGPGPISSQGWVEEALDEAAKEIDNKKLILGIAGYGYDWITRHTPDGIEKTTNPVTYSEAIDLANISKANIDFDNHSYNLHYTYTENPPSQPGVYQEHNVWFTDAETTFNILRFADEYGIAGTALWRMGSEDPRMWKFYNKDLDNATAAKAPFDFSSVSTIPINPNQKPTPVGEGEILNILSTPQEGKIRFEIDSSETLIAEEFYTQLPSGYVYEKQGEDTTDIGPGHKIILTFDDGPSADYTPKILDILEKEKVPATFFIVGLEAEKNMDILKRIYKDGFEIGNHTFTHHNIATMGPDRAELELRVTRLLLETVTGKSTILFRAPYNADSEPQTFEEIEPLARSKKDNYITVGESIDPNDWDPKSTADSIVARIIQQATERKANIILLHDAGGESREETVKALPAIIKYFKQKGCKFTTVADLIGKTRDEVMPPVKNDWGNRLESFFFSAIFWLSNILFALFAIGIILSVFRTVFMAVLAYIQKRKEENLVLPVLSASPFVSIIVPAYNEEVNAVRTVNSLLNQDYKNFEIVFVDDGSKDSTYQKVKDAFAGNSRVQVISKPNGGKATALNTGIAKANGEYVVCIDADTQLNPDAVSQLIKTFSANPGKNIAAVAGNVKVGNEINMITRWQSIEYITSQNFDRRAFDLLNCITVVPGAIGAFKKEALLKCGGFTTDTLAEDCDLTMRLHLNNYTVKNCTSAISYTEAPETMKQFLKQRFRWSFGVMQCFWKHRRAFMQSRYKAFGWVALPNILIYQIILPFLAPLADLVLVISLLMAALNIIPASAGHIVLYYLVFTVVDMAGAALAFSFEKEKYSKLLWMLPQRFIYRQLMYYILIKSFNRALKGELQGWGALKRTGNVNKAAPAIS